MQMEEINQMRHCWCGAIYVWKGIHGASFNDILTNHMFPLTYLFVFHSERKTYCIMTVGLPRSSSKTSEPVNGFS